MGVSGSSTTPRSDQRVLDVLHAQNVWAPLWPSDDMVANKKRLMSVRGYSGCWVFYGLASSTAEMLLHL